MKDFAKEVLTRGMIDGDIPWFYNMWMDVGKQNMSLIDFGRFIAQSIQVHGKFTGVGEPSEPLRRLGSADFWVMNVPLFVGDTEFFALISFNEQRRIGDFSFGRKCVYHQPSFIKEDRLERIVLCEKDPRTIYTRPRGAPGPIPVALYVQPQTQLDVEIRLDFSFVGRDWEFLAMLQVGLLRSEFLESQLKCGAPIVPYVSKTLEFAMQLPDLGGVYLILQSFAAMYIDEIAKKFPGVIDGIILINPLWFAPPDTIMVTMEERRVPKDVPLLVIGSGYDIVLQPKEFQKWSQVAKKIGAETVFYESCDHYLFACDRMPVPREYALVENHLSDVPLRKIAQWIHQQQAKPK
jgi:hypothetical protein